MSITAELRVALITLSLIFASACPSFGQDHAPPSISSTIDNIDPDRLKAAQEVLRLMEAEKIFVLEFPLKSRSQQVDPIKALFLDPIEQIYAREFSLEELKALEAFYGTAAGKKFANAVRLLMKDMEPMINNIAFNMPITIEGTIPSDRIAAAKEMIEVTMTEESIDTAISQLGKKPYFGLSGANSTAEDKEHIKKYWDSLKEKLHARRGELIEGVASIWAKNFTTEEMKSVSDFYRSEIGRRIIANTPRVMAEIQKVTQAVAARIAAELLSNFEEIKKKRGIE